MFEGAMIHLYEARDGVSRGCLRAEPPSRRPEPPPRTSPPNNDKQKRMTFATWWRSCALCFQACPVWSWRHSVSL